MSDEATSTAEDTQREALTPESAPSASVEPASVEPASAEPASAEPSSEEASVEPAAESEHEVSSAEELEGRPARGEDPRPYLVVTAIHDASARTAALTLSHADAWERIREAIGEKEIAGLDLVELAVPPRAFHALSDKLQRPADTISVYDVFPLAAHLGRTQRKVAGQFLAAEILWTLEEQGTLAGIVLNIRPDVPRSWGDRSPAGVRQKLVEDGALDLTEDAIADFRAIKASWDQLS